MTDHTPSGLPQPQTVAEAPYSRWVWQHVKSGGEYSLLGDAKLQTDAPLNDMAEVYVYQGEDGRMWARPVAEFNARFKRVRPLPVAPKAEPVAWINKFGGITKLPETAAAWRKDGGVRPLVYGDATPQTDSAQPVGADTLPPPHNIIGGVWYYSAEQMRDALANREIPAEQVLEQLRGGLEKALRDDGCALSMKKSILGSKSPSTSTGR